MRATLVIPTLNEAASIAHVLRLFRDAANEANGTIFAGNPLEWEVLVIDGASEDGTAAIAQAEGARVLVERRKGYGRAYKTGFAAARGDVIATADGDATYPVETIPGLVKKLLDEDLDFVTGNRFAYLDRNAMTTEHRVGNRLLNLFLGLAYHRYLKNIAGGLQDSQSGFWVFRRELLGKLHVTSDGMALARSSRSRRRCAGSGSSRSRSSTGSAGDRPSSRAGATGPGTSSSLRRSASPLPARPGRVPRWDSPTASGTAPARSGTVDRRGRSRYWVFPDRSRDFTRRPWYPHRRHWTALGGFRAEQFMQIFLLSRRSTASGNGMGRPPTRVEI